MSIKATCTCGAEFKANSELAGKRVKCPACGQAFTVPRPQAAADLIRVTCQCGKTMRAGRELAGKRVKCPACGGVVQVPAPQVAPDPLQDQASPGGLDLGSLAAMEFEAEVQENLPSLPAHKPVQMNGPQDAAADQARRAVAQDALKRAESELKAEKARRKAVTWWPLSPKAKVCAIVTAGFIALGGLIGLIFPTIGMFFVVSAYLVIGLAGAIGEIWLLIMAFEEDLVCGLLFLFVPFYPFYFLITRWDNSPPFLLVVGQIPAIFLVLLYTALLGLVARNRERGVVEVLEGESHFYSISHDGSDLTRLTSLKERCERVHFSSDGKKAVFNSRRDGNPEIYSMSVDGSNLKRLTNHPGEDASPVWSPDGTKIAWQSKRTDVLQIWVMNSDGTNKTRLTDGAHHYEPFWSADGTKIGFTSYRDQDFEIYAANADGTMPVRLTRSRGRDFGEAWSSDGRILFVSNRDSGGGRKGGQYEIYVMEKDGSNPRRLTNNPSRDSSSAWSPDAGMIVFVSGRDGNPEIYVMNADGSDQKRLTNDARNDASPSWSLAVGSDGKPGNHSRIVFHAVHKTD